MTQTRFFVDGMECQESDARESFAAEYLHSGGDPSIVGELWTACKRDEESRDSYLPSFIEIIAA